MGKLLCGAKNVLDGLGDPIVSGQFGFKLGPPLWGESIKTHLAIGLGDTPVGCDPAFYEHLLESGIEEAFLNREHVAGENVNPLGNGVAVK